MSKFEKYRLFHVSLTPPGPRKWEMDIVEDIEYGRGKGRRLRLELRASRSACAYLHWIMVYDNAVVLTRMDNAGNAVASSTMSITLLRWLDYEPLRLIALELRKK